MRFVFHKPYSIPKVQEFIIIPKNLTRDPSKTYFALPDACEALQRLYEAAEKDGIHILVISSQRPYDFQANYFVDAEKRHGKGKGALWVAPAGYSEHHTGYVFDLADRDRPGTDDEPSFETTPASDWLKLNARKFGFELSFPKENWQGVSYEPWHWRFVGSPKAQSTFHPSIDKKSFVIFKSILKAFGFISGLILFQTSLLFAEPVSFEVSDGIVLEAEFINPKPGKVTLILIHGYLSNKEEWEVFAKYCSSKGLGVFYFDMRGHGKSQGTSTDFKAMVSDLKIAVQTLQEKFKIPESKIAVGGASIGANIALQYFTSNFAVPFAILLSPGLDYQGISTTGLLHKVGTRPLFLAASSGDYYSYKTINALSKAARKDQNLNVIRMKSSSAHGVQMFERRHYDFPSEMERKLVKWIEENAK